MIRLTYLIVIIMAAGMNWAVVMTSGIPVGQLDVGLVRALVILGTLGLCSLVALVISFRKPAER